MFLFLKDIERNFKIAIYQGKQFMILPFNILLWKVLNGD